MGLESSCFQIQKPIDPAQNPTISQKIPPPPPRLKKKQHDKINDNMAISIKNGQQKNHLLTPCVSSDCSTTHKSNDIYLKIINSTIKSKSPLSSLSSSPSSLPSSPTSSLSESSTTLNETEISCTTLNETETDMSCSNIVPLTPTKSSMLKAYNLIPPITPTPINGSRIQIKSCKNINLKPYVRGQKHLKCALSPLQYIHSTMNSPISVISELSTLPEPSPSNTFINLSSVKVDVANTNNIRSHNVFHCNKELLTSPISENSECSPLWEPSDVSLISPSVSSKHNENINKLYITEHKENDCALSDISTGTMLINNELNSDSDQSLNDEDIDIDTNDLQSIDYVQRLESKCDDIQNLLFSMNDDRSRDSEYDNESYQVYGISKFKKYLLSDHDDENLESINEMSEYYESD